MGYNKTGPTLRDVSPRDTPQGEVLVGALMTANNDALPTATRVSDPGIRALYRLESRWQAWLPNEAAEAIALAARLELLDRARIDEGFARTGHTLVPLVWELSRVVGEPHGGWVHWGATTQNITQTGDLLVLRQAHRIFSD